MHLNNLLAVSTAAVSFFPLALAAPAPDSFLDLKRWFTLNPSNPGGPQIWSDHKLKYKFQDDDSKNKLGDVVTAGWRIWTDAGVDTANIDIVESSDDDALVIVAVNDAKAQTTVGKTGGAKMTFGVGSSYGFLDTNANMAHELGHALGFYHEHQRDDRGDHVVFNCKNLADWTQDRENQGFCDDLFAARSNGWSSLDFIELPQSFAQPDPLNCYGQTYDEDSIMHYSGGVGAAKPLIGHRKTVLGNKSDGKSFKKNTVPSTTDVARVNAMYATTENQARDVGKDCRSEARLTRTYTVPAALTSALQVTAAPIDITGTPIISSGDTSGPAETGLSVPPSSSSSSSSSSPTTSKPLPPATTPPPPPPTTTTPLDPSSVCIHVFTDPPEHTASCTTSISKSDLSTPLPDGAWTCLTSIFTVCYCQAEGDAQPCETLAEIESEGG
ncbi:MAG: hypothetical protein Q9190_001436 [Brigantiaea leucoxantha]